MEKIHIMDKTSLGIYEKAMPDQLNIHQKLQLAKKIGFDQVEISIDESDAKLNRIFRALPTI